MDEFILVPFPPANITIVTILSNSQLFKVEKNESNNKYYVLIFIINMDKPFWRDETICNGDRCISVRMYNPEKSGDKITEYLAYLSSIKTHLNGRIKNIDDMVTFYSGEMCCMIYLHGLSNINFK
jgi:hypothetical protein